MSVPVLRDPNRGPLKLQHDLTPRDLRDYSAVADQAAREDNFRYKGYPLGQFESPRNHTFGNQEYRQHVESVEGKNHHLPNRWDSNKPKSYDSPPGVQQFQYGSNEAPVSKPGPKPIRDPFKEKTSAEVLKYRFQQEEVEKDLQAFKETKKAKMMDRETEKKQDMEQLKNYYPWGKPGGGAPKGENKEPSSYEPTRSERTQRELVEEYGDFHAQFGKPGAGAPMKTESGRVRAIYQDPDIRFQDSLEGRKAFEKEVRYKKGPQEKETYSHDLNEQIQRKHVDEQEKRLEDLKKEMEMHEHNPFGKPGAGAPNHPDYRIRRVNEMPDMSNGYDDHLKSRSIFSDPGARQGRRQDSSTSNQSYYDPWGKGVGQPKRDQYGDVMRHKQSNAKVGIYDNNDNNNNDTARRMKPVQSDRDDPHGVSLDLGRVGGGGAPVVTESGTVKARMPITLQRDGYGDAAVREQFTGRLSQQQQYPRVTPSTDPDRQVYDPWGKGGGGAPHRDSRGNIQPNIYGRMKNETTSPLENQQHTNSKQEYLLELQTDMERQRQRKEETERNLKFGGGELAAVMKQGQVGRPRRDPNTGMLLDNHLIGSDVTRQQTNTRTLRTDKSELYHTELEKAAEDRKRYGQLERLKEKQESKHHQSTMDDFWGRPGAGAPNIQNKKSKLDEILNHSPRKHDPYEKKMPSGEDPYNHVKSTIPSTHVNMYQLDKPTKREAKPNYHMHAPFATDAEGVF